ncbi:MAG: hypothetical protein WC718_16870 [Phycisphaerales bacterium]|jgi:hypothetical protein
MGPQREVRRFSDDETAYICDHLGDAPVAVAHALNRDLSAVCYAQRRVSQGWATALRWDTCTICSKPVCGPSLPARSLS